MRSNVCSLKDSRVFCDSLGALGVLFAPFGLSPVSGLALCKCFPHVCSLHHGPFELRVVLACHRIVDSASPQSVLPFACLACLPSGPLSLCLSLPAPAVKIPSAISCPIWHMELRTHIYDFLCLLHILKGRGGWRERDRKREWQRERDSV